MYCDGGDVTNWKAWFSAMKYFSGSPIYSDIRGLRAFRAYSAADRNDAF